MAVDGFEIESEIDVLFEDAFRDVFPDNAAIELDNVVNAFLISAIAEIDVFFSSIFDLICSS